MESARPVGSEILSKTQVVVFVYLYTVFHVALGWTTILGSYTATKVKLQGSAKTQKMRSVEQIKIGIRRSGEVFSCGDNGILAHYCC